MSLLAPCHLNRVPQVDSNDISRTEIQIILLLEILAIMQQNKPSQADFPAPVEDEKSQKKKKSKKTSSLKKKYKTKPLKDSTPDPKILLELLLDRLCIWRSITSASAALEPSRQTAHQTKNGEDRLRHFCIEVVMQFYSSRLPETCAMIQKKFGANAVPSGTPRKPQPPRKKVLVPKPSLSRANTAPVTAAGSRAASVTLEASRAAPRKSVDLGAVAKRALQKREIQMPALNAARKINIEEELKDAIKGLAKPNRMAAGAEAMDAVTKRLGGSIRSKSFQPSIVGVEHELVY